MAFAVTRALRVFDVESARELADACAESLAAQRQTQESDYGTKRRIADSCHQFAVAE